MQPPEPCDRNIYEMTAGERLDTHIDSLPEDLKDALSRLSEDKVICEALGPHIYKIYSNLKMQEWDAFRIQVHQWEIDNYLEKF